MTTPTRRGTTRVGNVALWGLQIVLAGFFLMSAMGKFGNAEPAASTFAAIGWGDWFRNLTGALEVAGAVGLLVPRLAGVAGLAFVGLTACAALVEAFVSGGGVFLPLAVLVLCAVIAWGRRDGTARLWAALSRR
ncbi:DoxX family protein [Nonomuraea sp. NPDC048892]|uniref:DoxX family protein n=1 Tax=Nonomuraea sp. NPDC048892 TaxID=3154624 RepID=UPI0034004A99